MVSHNNTSFQKLYINDTYIVTLQCPVCKLTNEANVKKYIKFETSVRLRVKCSCGNYYTAILERRKFYRKEINIHGTVIYSVPNGPKKRGAMTVLDISRGGAKIKALGLSTVKKGDTLELEFHLNDKKQTLIKKQVIVRNVNNYIINTEFCSHFVNDYEDRDFAFYLH